MAPKLAPIESVAASAFTIPTDLPESDGTLEWGQTTLVLVEATAVNGTGIGLTYTDLPTAPLAQDCLAVTVQGRDAFATLERYQAMRQSVRNL